jgi:hypothetical protein
MAEDSGAFKTNPVNSRQIPAFYNDPGTALPPSLTGRGNVFRQTRRHHNADFLTSAGKPLRYSRISLIRGARMCRPRSRMRRIL